MSLGCNELTDDQLLEILQESLDELAQRSGVVREYAQKMVLKGAEKVKIEEDVLKNALEAVRNEYKSKLTSEVLKDLRQMVEAGEVRLISPADEANLSLEAERIAFRKLLAEAEKKMANTEEFSFSIRGPSVTINFGSQHHTVLHILNPQQVAKLASYVSDIVGV